MVTGLSASRKKTNSLPGWFKLGNPESKTVYPLQELNECVRLVEHSSPSNFMKHAECTILTGECYGCEQGTFPWGPRVKFYLPVLVSGKVEILVQGTGNNSVIHDLGKYFAEYGTIKHWFEISRVGEGKKSKYSAKPVDNLVQLQYNSNIDLSRHINKIAYSEQKKYYS